MNQSLTGEPLATITHIFEQNIKMDYKDPLKHRDLKHIMDALPHIKLKDGYSLGCFRPSDKHSSGEYARLYPFRTGSKEVYKPKSRRIDKERLNSYRTSIEIKAKQGDGVAKRILKIMDEDKLIPFLDGQYIGKEIGYVASITVPRLNDYIEIDLTPESIWESMLLMEESISYLPHFWHAIYSKGVLLVDDKSFKEVHGDPFYDESLDVKADDQPLRKYDMTELESFCQNSKELMDFLWEGRTPNCGVYPTVNIINEKEAVVSYCRWDCWNGILLKIAHAFIEGHSIHFKYEEPYTIFPYDCGICF